MKIYLVWKEFGMSGSWHFREKKNAEEFAASICGNVEVSEEYISAQELHKIQLSDGYFPELIERPTMQFNCYALI